MAEKKTDQNLSALTTVYAALKTLQPEEQRRVLSSVAALLELPTSAVAAIAPTATLASDLARASGPARPLSIVELLQEKSPKTNPQRLAAFAYYREKYEGHSRFSREDLEGYFSKAKETPPANLARDFNATVRQGWIHEDGNDSYLTSKGVEAVESSFAMANSSSPPLKRKRKLATRKTRSKK